MTEAKARKPACAFTPSCTTDSRHFGPGGDGRFGQASFTPHLEHFYALLDRSEGLDPISLSHLNAAEHPPLAAIKAFDPPAAFKARQVGSISDVLGPHRAGTSWAEQWENIQYRFVGQGEPPPKPTEC